MEWITTTQVLEDLGRRGDSPEWENFSRCFRTMIVNLARSSGLSAADAEDAAQETLLTFVKAFKDGKYDRTKGRLRDWLFGVARNVILNMLSHRPREKLIADDTGTSYWDMIEDVTIAEKSWQEQWRKMVLVKCLEQVRREVDAEVFRAFELYAMQEQPAEEVASRLGVSRNAVYIAKSRVLARLRQLETDFERTEG